MATVQRSIEVNVAPHAAYAQLTQFETYPRFMSDVESIQQIDDTHLHWTTQEANRAVEWDAEITEREPDHCIAWTNISGPTNTGRIEVQALGPDSTQVTVTLRSEPEQPPGSMAGYSEQDMAARLKQDLARLKEMMESNAAGTAGATSNTGMSNQDAHLPNSPVTTRTAQPRPASTGQPSTREVVGAAGGTDAAAGAQTSGSKGGPGGESLRKTAASTNSGDATGAPGGATQSDDKRTAPGAGAVGGTGLGSTASASDTRTGTGSTSGAGSALTGGGTSGARDAGIGSGKGGGA